MSSLTQTSPLWIVISGKMGCGKDTLAPLILPELGITNAELVGYSLPMRKELQDVINILTGRSEPLELLAKEVEEALHLKPAYALEMVELVWPEVKRPNHELYGHSRTEVWRGVLQKLGGYWRTEEDEAYWSRRVVEMCQEKLSRGVSVYLTGGRFLPDVELPKESGAVTIRLDVSREVQRARLMNRDGFYPSEETLNHPGETALDTWTGFDVRITNNGSLAEGLFKVKKEMEKYV